jgi:hypothetical protein
MKQDCARVQNEIWDALADGTAIHEDVVKHARSCSECTKTLQEARASLKMLKCAAPYPAAPDCRRAVLDRIGGRRRLSWALKAAWLTPVAALAVAGVLILPLRHGHTPAPMASKTPAAGVEDHRRSLPAEAESQMASRPVPRGATKRPAPVQPSARKSKTIQPKPSNRIMRRPVREIEKTAAAPDTAGRRVEMARVPIESFNLQTGGRFGEWDDKPYMRGFVRDAGRFQTYYANVDSVDSLNVEDSQKPVVAAVSVEWSPEPTTQNLSYQFREEDPDGNVTTGTVARKGDTIEIKMESTPAGYASKERGEVSNEENPAA